MKIIEVKNLKKNYKNFTAVNNISFSVDEGTIFGLLGPNGAGKTTTIECLVGIKKAKSKTLKILNYDVNTIGKELYNHVGVQLQETSYQDKVKVIELCKAFAAMYDNPINYLDLLEKFGLEDKHNSYVNDLSGGQKQKVAITLALIGNPKIVFLDELTTGLDPKSRREMWELVLDLKSQGITVFMTTHYMEEAAYLCDKIAIIDHGEILVIEDVEGVINEAALRNEVTFKTSTLDLILLEKDLKKVIDDVTISKDDEKVTVASFHKDLISEVIISLRRHKIDYYDVALLKPSLEDAYLNLIGKKGNEKHESIV